MVPETLASYLAYGTRIYFETITIPVSDICVLCEAPASLLKWNASNRTLDLLSQEVSVICVCVCMC